MRSKKQVRIAQEVDRNEWRDFALDASRIYKNRSGETDGYNKIADQLNAIANKEEAFFKKLRKAVWFFLLPSLYRDGWNTTFSTEDGVGRTQKLRFKNQFNPYIIMEV